MRTSLLSMKNQQQRTKSLYLSILISVKWKRYLFWFWLPNLYPGSLTRSDVITSLWLPGNNVSWVWSANTKSGDTYTSTRWYSPCIVIVTKMWRDYIVGGEKRQGKLSLFPYKHKLHQIKMCSLFPVASLCDNTRTKPTNAYSQAALTGNEMKRKYK